MKYRRTIQKTINEIKKSSEIPVIREGRSSGLRLVEIPKPKVKMDINAKMKEIMTRGGMLDG
jgi:hypothetical protein